MLFWCDFVIPLHAQTLTNDIGSFSFHIFDFFYSQNSWCAYFPFSNQNKPSYVIDVHQWFWLLDANTLFHTRMNVLNVQIFAGKSNNRNKHIREHKNVSIMHHRNHINHQFFSYLFLELNVQRQRIHQQTKANRKKVFICIEGL